MQCSLISCQDAVDDIAVVDQWRGVVAVDEGKHDQRSSRRDPCRILLLKLFPPLRSILAQTIRPTSGAETSVEKLDSAAEPVLPLSECQMLLVLHLR
jgi:hypothetical protein